MFIQGDVPHNVTLENTVVLGEAKPERVLAQVVNVSSIENLEFWSEGIRCIDSERYIARPTKAHARESARIVRLRQGDLVSNQSASHGVPRPGLNTENLLSGLSIYIL